MISTGTNPSGTGTTASGCPDFCMIGTGTTASGCPDFCIHALLSSNLHTEGIGTLIND